MELLCNTFSPVHSYSINNTVGSRAYYVSLLIESLHQMRLDYIVSRDKSCHCTVDFNFVAKPLATLCCLVSVYQLHILSRPIYVALGTYTRHI